MSQFKRVKQWMDSVGQVTDHHPKDPLPDCVTRLRISLLEEEMDEVRVALDEYRLCVEEGDLPPATTAHLIKELCDVLVVTHGYLAALGVNGEKAFNIVMDENDAKVAHREYRDDGKVITPTKIKCQLKQETSKKLLRMVTCK